MAIWQQTHLQQLIQGDDIQSTYEAALSLTHEMGFEYCSFALNPHSLGPPTQNMRINNYPSEWNKKYEIYSQIELNPIVEHCSHSVLPLLWDRTCGTSVAEEAEVYGLCYGWSQSVHDSRGLFSMLTLSRSRHPITTSELYEKVGQFIWLSHALHSAITRKMLSDGPGLSKREIEVLKWSADGKTASEIAIILCLSERTVNFHVNSAIKKLGVNNKISAVMQASRNGWL